MSTNISWTDYIVGVTILLAIYYLFIGLRFYINDLKNVFLKRQIQLNTVSNEDSGKIRSHSESDQGLYEQSQDFLAEEAKETFQEVENFIGRLKEAIEEGLRNQLSKEDFSQNLKLILNEYSSLKNSTFRAAIIELIISESEKYGSTTLNGNEVEMLWDSD